MPFQTHQVGKRVPITNCPYWACTLHRYLGHLIAMLSGQYHEKYAGRCITIQLNQRSKFLREGDARSPRSEAMLRRCVMLLIATLVSNGLSLHISSAGPPRGEASHSHLQQQQMSQQSAEKRQQQTPELLQAAREAEAKERITLFDVCADS